MDNQHILQLKLKMILQKLSQSDCGSNSCDFGGRGKGGMRVNGSCQCYNSALYEILDTIKNFLNDEELRCLKINSEKRFLRSILNQGV